MSAYGNYPDLAPVKRILVVKLRHHGDVLLASPVFSALKSAMPAAVVDAYIYRDTQPMLEGHPAIDDYRLYDRAWKTLPAPARLGKELGLLQRIRAAGYDLVINLTEGDRGAIAMWWSGARYRVGWDPQGAGFALKRRAYSHFVKRPRLPRHMVEQNLDALRRIGIFPSPEARELHFHLPDTAIASIAAYLGRAGINAGDYVLIHPTSRWLFKCWPVAKVAALIDELHARGHRIVLSSAPDESERAMVAEILSLCRGVPVLDLGGRLTLKELGALIAASRCVVGVDSVPMHIASALKKPAVALFGPSSDLAWGAWNNPRARIVTQPMTCRPCNLDGCGGGKVSDCLSTLPVGQVLDETLSLLESRYD